MSYRDTYEAWLASPALSAGEKAELESIRNDDKEIESRFFDQLAAGTAGLRNLIYRRRGSWVRHAACRLWQLSSVSRWRLRPSMPDPTSFPSAAYTRHDFFLHYTG